ncbi:MAG: hypothetical protein ACYCSI_15125 [Solirubrobacteraceae bacterium]
MRRAAIVLLVWGVWLGGLDGVQPIFSPSHSIQFETLGAASGAALLSGLGLWALDARRAAAEHPRVLSDSSFATAALISGLVLALLGSSYGLWLILIGAALAALGAGGLAREWRARRGAIALARRGSPPAGGGSPRTAAPGNDSRSTHAADQAQERVA